ncbi:hypothetical protein [Chakrabartyella piscis]|uniref:hypothetical protein n=1 Tax=Chakrabartyella piscis TaxID=2918914 RepID=UPI002958CA62|nr:hypothetical protein [Chakrabartyella piscis]
MKKLKMLATMLACAVFVSSCGSSTSEQVVVQEEFSDAVIMQIDGEDIMKSEYMVYLYTTSQSFLSAIGADVWTMEFDGITADDMVEERTMETIRKVVATTKYAAENDISMTDEEIAQAEASSIEFVASIPEEDVAKMGVTEEIMIKAMTESYLFGLVYQQLAMGYVVDEADLEAFYDEYRETFVEEYTYYNIDSVVVDDEAVAEEVLEKAKAGEDFGVLFDEYDVDEAAIGTESKGKMTAYKSDFMSGYGLETAPEVGVIDEIFYLNGVYYIMKIETIEIPNEEEAESLMQMAFLEQEMYVYAEEQAQAMLAEQEVVYMDEVFATVTPFHD